MSRNEELEFALKQLKAHLRLINDENNEHTVTDSVSRSNISYSLSMCNSIIDDVLGEDN